MIDSTDITNCSFDHPAQELDKIFGTEQKESISSLYSDSKRLDESMKSLWKDCLEERNKGLFPIQPVEKLQILVNQLKENYQKLKNRIEQSITDKGPLDIQKSTMAVDIACKEVAYLKTQVQFSEEQLNKIVSGKDKEALVAVSARMEVKKPVTLDISSTLEEWVKKYQLPGMSATVIHKDSVAAVGTNGIRTKNLPEKLTNQDLFHIGSCTKAMTATVLGRLVEKGILKWDTKVVDLFPELKGKVHASYQNLTLKQLLTHRSGLPANLNYWELQQMANNDVVYGRQLAMEKALSSPPETTPGNYLYSNLGYVIAGHMAEKATGYSWERLMKDMLFSPLGLDSAGFGAPGTAQSNSQPRGHKSNGEAVTPGLYADNPALMGPAGTVHCSLADWAKFIQLHLQGAQGEGKKDFLTKETFEQLHAAEGAYAKGWLVSHGGNGKVLAHDGSNTYWYALTWIFPEKDIAVMVTVNKGDDSASQACHEAANKLLQMMLK